MNKKEIEKIKTSFIMSGGFFSAFQLHEGGFGGVLSLLLGFIFMVILWLGVEGVIKNTFDK